MQVEMKPGKKKGRKLTALLMAMKKSDQKYKRKAKQRKVHMYIPVVSATDFYLLKQIKEENQKKGKVKEVVCG